jgi:hypothetical protein
MINRMTGTFAMMALTMTNCAPALRLCGRRKQRKLRYSGVWRGFGQSEAEGDPPAR